jgi:predicted RNA-binding Zn ribbon-like protein
MRNASLEARPAATVHLIGGRLCLDLINSVGARRTASGVMTIRDEKLIEYSDLIAWGWHAGILNGAAAARLERVAARQPAAAARTLMRALQLREALYRIATKAMAGKQPHHRDLAVLNRELSTARARERLAWQGGVAVWRSGAAQLTLDGIVCEVAQSAADLFAHGDLTRLRVCGGDDCGWLFEDVSRNGGRRWCDMRDCGNVAQVRRFRSRVRRGNRGAAGPLRARF